MADSAQLTCSEGTESSSELEEEEEVEEYFLFLLAIFLEDFLFEDFFSSLFLSLVDEGFESRSSEEIDLALLECFEGFFLFFGMRVLKLRGPEALRVAAGEVIKDGKVSG